MLVGEEVIGHLESTVSCAVVHSRRFFYLTIWIKWVPWQSVFLSNFLKGDAMRLPTPATITIVAVSLIHTALPVLGQEVQPAKITIKIYYLQDKGLLQAFKKENNNDPSSLAVREALKQAGFKVRVSAQEFDQNKQPVGAPQTRDFGLKIVGEDVEFLGDSKTAIFIDILPKEKSFYTLTIDAPPVGGGQSVFEEVVLARLHAEKMDISVVMPLATKDRQFVDNCPSPRRGLLSRCLIGRRR
jgi:hypothetical protein